MKLSDEVRDYYGVTSDHRPKALGWADRIIALEQELDQCLSVHAEYSNRMEKELALMKMIRPSQQEIDDRVTENATLKAELAEANRRWGNIQPQHVYLIGDTGYYVNDAVNNELVALKESNTKLRDANTELEKALMTNYGYNLGKEKGWNAAIEWAVKEALLCGDDSYRFHADDAANAIRKGIKK